MANPNVQYLIDWCSVNNIAIKRNSEVFFVNESTLIRPEYVLKNNIFIDLVDKSEINDRYIQICKDFSLSFGIIILMSFDVIPSLTKISKADFEEKYDIKF